MLNAISLTLLLATSIRGADHICPSKLHGEGRTVVPGYGIVEGTVECSHVAFLGVPYAKPPTESLRWRPPQQLDPPTGFLPVFNASKFAPSCIQLRSDSLGDIGKMLLGLKAEAEDCLYLNIFKKRSVQSSGPLPVIFFIHGGSFTTGGSAAPLYNPTDLITNGLKGEAIFVSFNYRLGIFGYAASDVLLKDSKEPVGNYGLLDQKAALEWVKKNIAAFNGDPNNITVMGHSAGAMSASYLQLLFPTIAAKWILLSGTALGWHQRRADGVFENKVWEKLAKDAGCETDDIGCMKAVNAGQLTATGQYLKMDYLFGPTIDGRWIEEGPRELLEKNKDKVGPTVLTVVRDEASIFIGPLIKLDADYERMVHEYYGSQLANTILAKYSSREYSSAFTAANAAITDAMFTCPAITYFKSLPKSFFTQFNHPMVVPSLTSLIQRGIDYGVFHGSDLVLLFNFNPFITLPNLREMNEMRDGILRFIKTGSPFDVSRPITISNLWSDGIQALFRGQCQAVWSLLNNNPILPRNYQSKLPLE